MQYIFVDLTKSVCGFAHQIKYDKLLFGVGKSAFVPVVGGIFGVDAGEFKAIALEGGDGTDIFVIDECFDFLQF